LQCFARDADWAQCDTSCTPGVHEGDPAPWSCNPMGHRSKPGCASFDSNATCPSERCEWRSGGCIEPCWSFSSDVCRQHDRCTWIGDGCKDACWAVEHTHECFAQEFNGHKRCQWRAKKCEAVCSAFDGKEACQAAGQCIWQGECKPDPCSAPGEDCTDTRCCSQQRGGAGMTCFKKDDRYATCAKACLHDDWDCGALGNRTKTDPKCAWAGEDCSAQGLCCNLGFVCGQKDQYFSGCYQVFQGGVVRKNVPPPPGWPAHPKFVGGGQFQYAMPAAGPGQEKMGTSLYCFMAYLPGSYEERLMEIARANYASAFACDAHDLFHTRESTWTKWDDGQATLSNIEVFIEVWNKVKEKGTLWKYDWTVKVDPDCLIVPQRLKWHLGALNAPAKQPIYVKNNAMNAAWGNDGFLGAVEVFSREALELYFDWYPKCKETIGLYGGEDGFIKQCMDALGVGYMTDGVMFNPDNDPSICLDGKFAAYHPLKVQESYQCCVDVTNGGSHSFSGGQCTDLNPGWVEKVWPGCPGGQCREPRRYAR